VPGSRGESTDRLILNILRKSCSPQTDEMAEALICNGDEAFAAVEKGRLDVPLFTESQQHFRWRPGVSPILQLFRRMEEHLSSTVSVQVSSRKLTEESAVLKSFQEVQERFLGEKPPSNETWNLL